MGSITQKLKDITGATEDEKAEKERLQLLLVAAKAKIRAYRDEFNEMFMNPQSIEKTQIPGYRAIRYIEQYHVTSSEGFSDKVGKHLDSAISAFFSISSKEDSKGAVQSGLKSLLSIGLDSVLGSTVAGETEEKIYIVVPENNAFIRVDIACWKYNFTQSKIIGQEDTAVAYVLCKSVIDHKIINIDELIYLVSEALNKRDVNTPRSKWVSIPGEDKKNKYVCVKTNGAGKPVKNIDENQEATKPEEYKIVDPPVNEYGASSLNNPPTIGVVEAYIEELIRVWKKLKEAREE